MPGCHVEKSEAHCSTVRKRYGALQAVYARFHQSEMIAQLLHLVEEELGTRIHGAEGLLQAGVVVMGIQTRGARTSL